MNNILSNLTITIQFLLFKQLYFLSPPFFSFSFSLSFFSFRRSCFFFSSQLSSSLLAFGDIADVPHVLATKGRHSGQTTGSPCGAIAFFLGSPGEQPSFWPEVQQPVWATVSVHHRRPMKTMATDSATLPKNCPTVVCCYKLV
jgi:hypothetical protein